ncbi:MAG: 16S rRNA (cytidine(1402)-2'-O)-methyltransferase [Desulfobacca sp. RBG_16_60_12]|nr:MAG: 16S rRNA (cytidine(1402)-2'-O)-methyltransferase [Desulfobacca sp. RBG_16_60_12]
MPGKLTLIATPIGNLGDLSERAKRALSAADVWIVEDTRQSGKLQAHLGLKRPMLVLNDHTSEVKVHSYAREAEAGKEMAVLTDAGCPGISDPGAHLADLCYELGIPVEAVPGPSAVTTALMLSGYYAQRFVFLGYLPRKSGAAKKELEPFFDSPHTLVLFESAFRAKNILRLAGETLGERRYSICREMTKVHEQVFRSQLPNVPTSDEAPEKGEWTIVIEGRRKRCGKLEVR